MKCLLCGGAIKAFGDRRQNGKTGRKDFDGRKYHLKCYSGMEKESRREDIYKDWERKIFYKIDDNFIE